MAGPLEILIVEGEEPITAALAATLGKRGHRVATARDVETALALPTPDVFVCETRGSPASGFDLLSAIAERGERARSVLLLSEPTVEDCLRAVRMGATALLAKPFRLAELVSAVEEADARRPSRRDTTFERSHAATPHEVERCVGELLAHCLRNGVPASTRARIAGCASEILDNAARHGRGGKSIQVRGRFEGSWLQLEIEDAGPGFDTAAALAAIAPGPALTGLARARALSDGFTLSASPAGGTLAGLRFCVASIAFAEGGVDLSEADYLAPGQARAVLLALLDGETPDVTGVSPAIAVVLGRLLAGPDAFDLTPERTPGRARLP